MPRPRMTLPTQSVLQVMLEDPDREFYGLELARASGLESGTIYALVTRLLAAGWLRDRWEDAAIAHAEGRPPRRFYTLTAEGRTRAIHALAATRERRGIASTVLGRALEGGAGS